MRLLLKRKVKRHNALVLTFDDGPGSRLTRAIMNILAENNAKATFFLLGKNITGREEIVKEIAEQGHDICSHGYDHLHYWKVSPFLAISDIKRGWQAIDRALNRKEGVYPFRPPYGKLNLPCLLYLWIRKVPIFYWTSISRDTWPVNKQNGQCVSSLASRTGGAVVLSHDFDRANEDINNKVIDFIRSSLLKAKQVGMQVITLSELLSRSPEN
jgi:peptidoglycan/xylan/chitin deacetylase (PgdA/CDA1 family)